MNFSTQIIHSLPIDELTGAISVPIYQTSTFVQELPGVNKGFDYSRSNNPTRQVLEDLIAAAIDAVVKLLSSGDEVVAVDDIYGGTFRLFTHIYSKFGIKVTYVDATEVENIIIAVNDKTKIIWLESPTNPTLKISDIKRISKFAKSKNILTVLDNTFATPISQRGVELGADIVVHSATKYLAGHSDVIAGLVVTANQELGAKIKFIQNSTGGILGPWDSWLVIRGIETLSLRFEKHCSNALYIAKGLKESGLTNNIFYPGFESHKNHLIAKEQQNRLYGGIISFDLKTDTIDEANKFVSSTKLFKLAESLGGVKSLICHPAQMTHKSTPSEVRKKAGISDSLIRISVGLEDAEDLLNDLIDTLRFLEGNK
ncbi:MAG: PLP-dependent aspartate aminotransferase family protein [Candidatus Kapabacteria bacterium]|nr:PLP-dependent aspartate aminotransferase family protein [Candidatus Kapabacteria bacterium]